MKKNTLRFSLTYIAATLAIFFIAIFGLESFLNFNDRVVFVLFPALLVVSAHFMISSRKFKCPNCGAPIFSIYGIPSIFAVKKCTKCGEAL